MMRKILQITAPLSIPLYSSALDANSSRDERKKVKEENKARVVFFFSKYCEHSNMTGHGVLSDRETRGTLVRDVVCLRADVNKNPDAGKKTGCPGLPYNPSY